MTEGGDDDLKNVGTLERPRHLGNLGASQRKAALKFGVILAYENKIVRTKTRLSYQQRKRIRGATDQQKERRKKTEGKMQSPKN